MLSRSTSACAGSTTTTDIWHQATGYHSTLHPLPPAAGDQAQQLTRSHSTLHQLPPAAASPRPSGDAIPTCRCCNTLRCCGVNGNCRSANCRRPYRRPHYCSATRRSWRCRDGCASAIGLPSSRPHDRNSTTAHGSRAIWPQPLLPCFLQLLLQLSFHSQCMVRPRWVDSAPPLWQCGGTVPDLRSCSWPLATTHGPVSSGPHVPARRTFRIERICRHEVRC